jgi:ribosome biogenesis GTPase A/uncharacterized protein YukE
LSEQYINQFLTYLMVVDNQIDDREMLVFQDYLQKQDLSEEEQSAIIKILTNAEDKKPLDEIIDSLKGEQQMDVQATALQMGLTISLCTHFYDDGEKELLHKARRAWGISEVQFNEWYQQAETVVDELIDEVEGKSKKSALFHKLSSPQFMKLLDVIHKWSPKTMQKKLEELNQKILLNGPEYGEAIAFCKRIAEADFQYAFPILEAHKNVLEGIYAKSQELMDLADDQKEQTLDVKGAIMDLQKQVHHLVNIRLQEVSDSLYKKKRAMNYFTISFMGKTKAGKSTLHAVITGKGAEEIGKGKQRTTRYNRVYVWNNIRIIDTPGIGAPGGKSDEEIAKTIIDESDVICYVVKNDSIQSAEFAFLQEIKKKNKPIIILLNVKENLDHPARLKRFLESPEHMYERKDAKSLDGHVTRIRRYASEHYKNDLFDIIPVQLYASLLSKDESFQPWEKAVLYKGSHVEQFLNSLRISIIEDGHIRRSQTIIDGLIYPVTESYNLIHGYKKIFFSMSEKLKKSRRTCKRKLGEIYQDTVKRLEQAIKKEFSKLEDKIVPFANSNYDCKENELKKKWQQTVKSIGFEKGLEAAMKAEFTKYGQEIEEYLKEMVEDLNYAGEKLAYDMDVDLPFLFDMKRLFGYIAGVGGLAAAFSWLLPAALAGPVGWIGGAVAVVGTLLTLLFKSKKKKIKEAIDKLTDSLEESVSEQKQAVKKKVLAQFKVSHQDLEENIINYQETIIAGLAKMDDVLVQSEEEIRSELDMLNKAYAYRLLTSHLPKADFPVQLRDDIISGHVKDVNRIFGKEFRITSEHGISAAQQVVLSKKLQEQVIVETKSAEEREYVDAK